VVSFSDGGLQDAILQPKYYFPSHYGSFFAPAWTVWYLKSANPQTAPMEPPAEIRKQMDLYDRIRETVDTAEQNRMFNDLLVMAQDMFYVIGVSLVPPGYGIKKANFRNVPASMAESFLFSTPGPTMPEQYYFATS
jgi:peptide/nickel transport system substrate-binding protein